MRTSNDRWTSPDPYRGFNLRFLVHRAPRRLHGAAPGRVLRREPVPAAHAHGATGVGASLVEASHGGAAGAPTRLDRVNDEHCSFPFRGTSVRSAGPSSGARRAACVVHGAMEAVAPEAIGLGLGLGQSTQTVSAECRS